MPLLSNWLCVLNLSLWVTNRLLLLEFRPKCREASLTLLHRSRKKALFCHKTSRNELGGLLMENLLVLSNFSLSWNARPNFVDPAACNSGDICILEYPLMHFAILSAEERHSTRFIRSNLYSAAYCSLTFAGVITSRSDYRLKRGITVPIVDLFGCGWLLLAAFATLNRSLLWIIFWPHVVLQHRAWVSTFLLLLEHWLIQALVEVGQSIFLWFLWL